MPRISAMARGFICWSRAPLDETLRDAQVRVPVDWDEQYRPGVTRARVQRID